MIIGMKPLKILETREVKAKRGDYSLTVTPDFSDGRTLS